jgi:hypothetical protein
VENPLIDVFPGSITNAVSSAQLGLYLHSKDLERRRPELVGSARGLRQSHRRSVLDQLSVVGHWDIQSPSQPVLPAGASLGSTVLPGTTRLPPAAWVTFTRRA